MGDIPTDPSLLIKCPIDLEWVIDRDMALEILDDMDATFTRTVYFPGFGSIFYHLIMKTTEDENNVQLYLEFDSYSSHFKLNFNVKIHYSSNNIPGAKTELVGSTKEDQLSPPELNLFKIDGEEWANPNNGIFTNNQLSIHIEGYAIIEEMNCRLIKLSKIDKKHHQYTDLFFEVRDFVIVAEETEIKVHKHILQQESPVFARMFESNWKETIENRIEIPEFSYETVGIVIETFYISGSIENLAKDAYFQLFRFADIYDMQMFKKALKYSIDFLPYNIVEYANLAVEYELGEFEEWCMDYLILCLKCEYPVANIGLLNDKTKNAYLQKLHVSPKPIGLYNWKYKSVNDESGIDDDKMQF